MFFFGISILRLFNLISSHQGAGLALWITFNLISVSETVEADNSPITKGCDAGVTDSSPDGVAVNLDAAGLLSLVAIIGNC